MKKLKKIAAILAAATMVIGVSGIKASAYLYHDSNSIEYTQFKENKLYTNLNNYRR